MHRIESIIRRETRDVSDFIISEVIQDPTLKKEMSEILNQIVIPVLQTLLGEIRDALFDHQKLSKEQLSELYFKTGAFRSQLIDRIENQMKRGPTKEEVVLFDKITGYFENTLAELWLEF